MADVREIKVRLGDDVHWVEVSENIFRSWTGPRQLNGQDYTGPVYLLGSDTWAWPKESKDAPCQQCGGTYPPTTTPLWPEDTADEIRERQWEETT